MYDTLCICGTMIHYVYTSLPWDNFGMLKSRLLIVYIFKIYVILENVSFRENNKYFSSIMIIRQALVYSYVLTIK